MFQSFHRELLSNTTGSPDLSSLPSSGAPNYVMHFGSNFLNRWKFNWYEVRNPGGTPQVDQQSTFAPDSNYRWMGSIAQDKQGQYGCWIQRAEQVNLPKYLLYGPPGHRSVEYHAV